MAYAVDGRSFLGNHPIGEVSISRPTKLAPSHALGGLRGSGDRDPRHGNALLQTLSLQQRRAQREGVRVEAKTMRTSAQREAHSLSSALRTTNRGLSIVDTAREGLSSIREKLEEMLSLAKEGKDAPSVGEDRDRMNERFEQLKLEIDQVSATTNFNGKSLLDGSLAKSPLLLNVGTKGASGDLIELRFSNASSEGLELTPLNVGAQEAAQSAETSLEGIIAGFEKGHQGRADNEFESLGRIAQLHTAGRERAIGRARELEGARQEAFSAREFSTRDATAALVVQASIQPGMAMRLLG